MAIKAFQYKAALSRGCLPAFLALVLTACGGEPPASEITSETGSTGARPAAGIYLIAGDISNGGAIDPVDSVDGQGTARLAAATLTKGAAGNLYFTQRRPGGGNIGGTGLTLRKVSSNGTVTTLAGPGQWWGASDPLARAEEFSEPTGIHIDAAGDITIVERGILASGAGIPFYRGGATLRRISSAGELSTLAGQPGDFSHIDGPGATARFESLTDVASDSAGNLYVADSNTIRRVTSHGAVSTFATVAPEDGFAISLNGLAIDTSGTIYASDTRCVIRRFAPDGSQTILAGKLNACGYADGVGAAARFVLPSRIVISPTGDIYVADGTTIRKVTPSGIVTTVVGSAGKTLRDPGSIALGALPGSLYWPTGMVFVAPNELAVASGSAILKVVLP